MTWLPRSRNLRANARPIPAEPPVIRIVRPMIFIRLLCSFDFCKESFRLWTQRCLSLIPLTFSVFWGSMAYTLIGGTAVGTVLTLIFLPALYSIWFGL